MPLAGAIVVGALGFGLGLALARPEGDLTQEEFAPEPVIVAAERRPIQESGIGSGVVSAGDTVTIIAPAPGDTVPVVTGVPAPSGSVVTTGTVVAEVSDRPVFLLRGLVPPTRDLRPGLAGEDVSRFQAGLRAAGRVDVPDSGRMDDATLSAVEAMYRDSGYSILGEGADRLLPRNEFVFADAGEVTVGETAPVGAVLIDDPQVATLRVGANVVAAQISALRISAIAEGDPVLLTSGAAESAGRIRSIGAFQDADASTGGPAGYPVIVEITGALGVEVGAVAEISTIDVSEEVLAVPAIAVREDDDGTYVLLADSDGRTGERVSVDIEAYADGWARLSESGPIVEGTRVLID